MANQAEAEKNMKVKIPILIALSFLLSASVISGNEKTIEVCGSPVNFSWAQSGVVGTFPPAPGAVYGTVTGVTVSSSVIQSGEFSGIIAKQCPQSNLQLGEIEVCGVPLNFSLTSVATFPPPPGQVYGKATIQTDNTSGKMTSGSFAGVVAKACAAGDLVRVYKHHWYGWSEDQGLDHAYSEKSQ